MEMEKESEREKEGMPGLKGRLLLSIHHCHLLALAGQIASDRKKNKKKPELTSDYCTVMAPRSSTVRSLALFSHL